ncbi:hypothetical protein [Blastococcus sp. TF02A-35]|uniref:hypothetical protein n=1 Tax=Blastococcus sp. TF02A-35 TaxID=2559612 RepID=UPI001073BD20|nr:hypothetical protein [Blastococcus sp. TF02A_35]TFV53685.1 hypothetical protein E4P43_00030 [Blastococcus sp. TF02A_35]
MTSGIGQTASHGAPALRRGSPSLVLGATMAVAALAATLAPVRARGAAAAACDVLERGGAVGLMLAAAVLLAVNVAVAIGLWAGFRRQGWAGVAAAVVLAVVALALTAAAFLLVTEVPPGYPTPGSACPGGRPTWWPGYLPG